MAETTNEMEKLDITAFVDAFLHALKKLWIVVLVLALALGVYNYFRTQGTYIPAYKAEATVAVYSSDDGTTANSRSAQQLGTVFPYILTSGILKDVIKEDMGVSVLPGNIKVTNVEGTNLLTITVSSDDPNLSYNTLLSIIKNYPKVAEYVVGYSVMEIIDDSGVPTDSGKTVAVRGNALKGASIGLALGLGIVFLYMLMNKTVRSVRDVKAFSTIDHLGTLPVYKKKKRKDVSSNINILEHNVQQDYLEAMRLIRTRVMRKLESNNHKVLMVTSSVPGEGKSTIAANLAISLAGKNKSVILVDCDLRNPSLHEIFMVPEDQSGFMEVFNGKISLQDAIVSFTNYGIHLGVLFGSPENATRHSEILGSEKTGTIIEELKKMADIVILDTPPSAMLVDAMLVSKYIDEAIYVIMSDYARTSVIAEGMQELRNAGIEIGGFVLNGTKASLGGYGYKYYGYGSHYYGYQDEDTDVKEEADEDDAFGKQEIIEKPAEEKHIFKGRRAKKNSEVTSNNKSQTVSQQKPVTQARKETTQAVAQQKTVTQQKPVTSQPDVKTPAQQSKPTYVGRHGRMFNEESNNK